VQLAAGIYRALRHRAGELGLTPDQLVSVAWGLREMKDLRSAALAYGQALAVEPVPAQAVKGLLQVAETLLRQEGAAEEAHRLYRLLLGKYYVDEAYDAVIVRPLVRGSAWVYRNFDLKVIDGALNGTAATARAAGRGLSVLQSGLVRDYALAFLLGAIVFLGVLLL
jgi:NADH:ubiquinone oxidoreductase subunit 5 (subunit L)/multisubunit Na+/H+ antiporter MnhA subunit